MTNPEPIIDFKEMISGVPGEALEKLARLLGRKKGLSPSWSGRGADGGRDLFFTEILEGPLSQHKTTWLVSCKDKARSGESVGESDLPSIADKLSQHKADGFLLVTTTTVSTGAKSLLDGINNNEDSKIHTLVWDSADLTSMLLEPANQDILQQFLPKSYERMKGMTSLEGAVLAFRDQIPDSVLTDIMRLVRPYSEVGLKGAVIWPYDTKSAEIIDRIVMGLLINRDTRAAISATGDLEHDAFASFIGKLCQAYPSECYDYLFALIRCHQNANIRFNAAQVFFDNYEINSVDKLEIASHLDSDALEELYGSEIATFVTEELFNRTPDYQLHQSLDELSSATRIDDITIETIYLKYEDEHISFSGEFTAALFFDREEMGARSFDGEFKGYFDENGIYLESADVDTSSFFGK